MLLEKTQLAHAFGRDAARRDIGDGAGSEIEARVRDVHFVGQDGDADRLFLGDRRIHESEQNIQVMNHDVVNDVDIQAARREYAEAMNFKVKWTIHYWHHRGDSGIESFQVPYLQNSIRPCGRGNKLVGLGQRSGHRLFDDDVDPEFQQAAADARVLDSRYGHTGRV